MLHPAHNKNIKLMPFATLAFCSGSRHFTAKAGSANSTAYIGVEAVEKLISGAYIKGRKEMVRICTENRVFT